MVKIISSLGKNYWLQSLDTSQSVQKYPKFLTNMIIKLFLGESLIWDVLLKKVYYCLHIIPDNLVNREKFTIN